MTEDVPPRGRASHSLAVYHVPDNSLAPPEGLRAQSSAFTTRNSTIAQGQPDSASIYPSYPPTIPVVEGSVAKPVARRAMYDPVRDSVTSSSPAASPSHTAAAVGQPTPQYNKPKPIYPDISVSPIPPFDVGYQPHSEDDSVIRTRIIREYSPYHYDSLTTADQGPQLQYAHYTRPLEIRGTDGSSAVYRAPADTELGAVLEGAFQPHKKYAVLSNSRTTSTKRRYAALEDNVKDRPIRPFSTDTNDYIYADSKGKGKATVSQSPAFRLDNILGPATPESPQAQPAGSDGDSERSPSESRTIDPSPAETPYVFTGKLPPPPFTGHSSVPSSSYPLISVMGISVSSDVDLGRFAVPDDFERAVISTQGPITNAMRSTLPSASHSSSNDPTAKLARKHTAQRRKARGLFPQDNVPLAISTTTTKQSRYRPSGDRQPVACGYKDPITGVQCDEPFNRSVELRRHVRAVHVPAEALAVTVGQLSRSQASLLPADWKPGDGGVLRPKCVCGKEFSRLDALRRHWTGVNAEVKDGKCISCPSSIGKKKDHAVYEQQGTESTYSAPVYS